MKHYKKLLDNCFIAKNNEREITAFLKYKKSFSKDKKYYCEVLIFDDNFRFTLNYVIESCPTDENIFTNFLFDTHTIDFNFDRIDLDYWRETMNSIEQLVMHIFDEEYTRRMKNDKSV